MGDAHQYSVDVAIRAPQRSDVQDRLALGFSNEIRMMFGVPSGPVPDMRIEQAQEWFDQISNHPCAWCITSNGNLVGEARLDDVNPHDKRARLAIGLFAEHNLGQGIGRKAINQTLQHGFGTLGLHRIDLRVLAFNTRAIRCYLACGFVQEGVERDAANIAGQWHDDIIMSILDREFVRPQT